MEKQPEYIKTHTLESPVVIGDRTVSEIKFIQPRAKHLKGLVDYSGTDKMLMLAGKISNETTAVFEEMTWKDWFAIDGIIDDFLIAGGITGKET